MLKKIILIFIFVGVTVGVAFLLYRFFFASGQPTEPGAAPSVTTPSGGLPTAGEGAPTAPGEAPGGLPASPGTPAAETLGLAPPGTASDALGAPGTIATSARPTSGGLNYYNSSDGRFYRIDGRGNSVKISDRDFPSVSGATWADDGSKAVIEFPDESKIIYDFDKETQISIPKHWEDFDFSADGDMIVGKSIGLDPANRWLISFASDGSNAKLIEPLGENADKVTVSVSPDESIVAFSDTGDPVGFDTRDLLPIGQNQENLQAVRVEGFDFIPQWSPDGKRLLYSAAAAGDDYLPTLWAVRADGTSVGGGRVKLDVHTWADKCTFTESDVVYCAEPLSLPVGAGLQRDIADATPDRLVKIDLSSGTVRGVTPAAFDSTVRTLTLSDDGSALFVVDAFGQITRVDLF
ncbi:MAG: hypothetical protein AAB554_03825 [Patescibacteria group bacterium]